MYLADGNYDDAVYDREVHDSASLRVSPHHADGLRARWYFNLQYVNLSHEVTRCLSSNQSYSETQIFHFLI